MKAQTMMTLIICSLFLTAQAAVDSGRYGPNSAVKAPNQMPKQLSIQGSTDVYLPNTLDLQLKDRVQQQLRTGIQNFDPNRVTILSQNGEITLKGIVNSSDEADAIENEVKQVSGVTRVQNKLLLSLD